ncbi:MAG: spore cortex biosynthesis protein YabQ, partial [Defluviitaleaceae bacterium]|nr:spore cortex biosynthesis protein YabQ [Defluviitaleaceae bacterium]
MILSMSGQAWLFLTTVAAGFVIGFVYDLFRILRKTVKHGTLWVQLEDILYWLAVSLLMFYFMLHRNYGEIRFFSIAGAALGMIIYFYSVSFVVIKVSVAVIEFSKKVLFTVARILLAPVRWLLKILMPPCRWLYRWLRGKARGTSRHIKRGASRKVRKLRGEISILLKKV